MTYFKFFSLLSVSVAFLASVFFAKGILELTTKFIYELSRTIFAGNPNIATSFIKQKSDYICGIIFLAFSLIMQFILIFIDEELIMFANFSFGIIILLALLIFSCIIGFILRKKFVKKFDNEMKDFWNKQKEKSN